MGQALSGPSACSLCEPCTYSNGLNYLCLLIARMVESERHGRVARANTNTLPLEVTEACSAWKLRVRMS